MDDFKQLFEERRTILDGKATQYREERDSWNEKTKELVSQRNEFNSEVRELIQLSDQQKQVREQMNQVVREKKGIRNEASKKVSEIRDKLRADQPEEKPTDRGPRGRRERPITLQSLQREFSRLERELVGHVTRCHALTRRHKRPNRSRKSRRRVIWSTTSKALKQFW